jgi:uncharacterized membrane protein
MSNNKRNPNKAIIPQQTAVFSQQTYLGPIPDPTTLAGYNQIDPTFAERVMLMAEKEQQHRHQQNVFITEGNTKLNVDNVALVNKKLTNDRLGNGTGFASVLVIAGICVYAFHLGYATQAAAIACTVFASLAGVFVFRNIKTDQQKETDNLSNI